MEQDKEYSDYNKNKKTNTILYILTLLSLFLLLLSWFNLNSKIENIELIAPVYKDVTNITEENKVYMLKEYNGKLAVYIDNDFQYEIDVYAFTLPEEDRKLLSKGIEVASEQELNEVISSYY